MIFSYNTYLDVTFILPAVMLALMLILLISSSCVFLVKVMHKRWTITAALGYVFCLLIVISCSFPQVKYLKNGGMHLLRENEKDALIRTGVIESVCEPSENFPGFKSSHSHGADIVIAGEQYFAITCGEFTEGDCVIVHYLPNSHFILSIAPADASKCESR